MSGIPGPQGQRTTVLLTLDLPGERGGSIDGRGIETGRAPVASSVGIIWEVGRLTQ
jgi:hypothetical protein